MQADTQTQTLLRVMIMTEAVDKTHQDRNEENIFCSSLSRQVAQEVVCNYCVALSLVC